MCGNEEMAIAGIGQGNGLWPSLWCFISTILFKICKIKGHGMTIVTAISKTVVSPLGFAFVDNGDLVSGADNAHTSGETTIEQFQDLMTCWSDGIRATGGLIVSHKKDGSPLLFSKKDLTGNTKLKTLSLGILPYLIRTATCILPKGKNQQKYINCWT